MAPFALLLFWLLFWSGLHVITIPVSVWVLRTAFPVHAHDISKIHANLTADQVAYWRRCFRGMVYYGFATVCGFALLGDFTSVHVSVEGVVCCCSARLCESRQSDWFMQKLSSFTRSVNLVAAVVTVLNESFVSF